ncbi:MAG: tetraacyldisaccharide 4'-kinase [Chthonomonadales bacterium]
MMDYLIEIIEGKRKGVVASVVLILLTLLAYVYMVGLKLFLLPYKLGIRKQFRLPCPVVSVGNLTVGGTGKTPMTLRLCELLLERGLKVVVLNRGYRGASEYGVAIVSDYKRVLLSPEQAGDEATMLAGMLKGVPVVVGKDRRVSGSLAVKEFQPDLILLDDGMQFYQLHRDFEITLLLAEMPFDNGWPFPRGKMREPMTHLKRSSAVVLTRADRVTPTALEALKSKVKRLAPGRPIYEATFRGTGLSPLMGNDRKEMAWLQGRKVGAFCALGNPEGFREQLMEAGAEIVHWQAFPDHHALTMAELQGFLEQSASAGAEAVIVTDKDGVKLPPIMRPLPIYSLRARMVLQDEEEFVNFMLKAVGRA